EEGREVAADDLARRPPERLRVDDGDRRPRLGAEKTRNHAGQQEPAQNGPERRRLDVGTRRGRDCRRCRVDLLSREPTLLDGEERNVAGGIDVDLGGDAPVRVGRDEPVEVVPDTPEAWAFEPRQRDHSVNWKLLAWDDGERSPPRFDRCRLRLQLDAT